MSVPSRLPRSCAALVIAVSAAVGLAAPKVEELIVGPAKAGGHYVIARDGAHIAYAGLKGDKYFVSVDGKEGPLFDEILKLNGGGYLSIPQLGYYLPQPYGRPPGDSPVAFSDDGEHHAYIGTNGDVRVIMVDGKELARVPRQNLASNTVFGAISITPLGKHVHWFESEFLSNVGRSRGRMVVDGKPGPWEQSITVQMLTLSRDESRYAYVTGLLTDTNKPALVIDGKVAAYFGSNPVFSGDNSTLYAIGSEGVLANGKLIYPGQITKLFAAPAGKSWAAFATKMVNTGTFNVGAPVLVVDGQEIPGTTFVEKVSFSPNGKRYAAVGHNPYGNQPWVIVVDGKLTAYPRIDPQDPYWTADSSAVVYTAGPREGSVIVINDDVYSYDGSFGGVTLAEEGGKFAWQAADSGRRQYTVVFDAKNTLPPGVYPTSAVALSRDGSRHAYLVGPLGRGETTGIVIDGQLQTGFRPGTYFRSFHDALTEVAHVAFSPDNQHAAYVAALASPNHAILVDGKTVHTGRGRLAHLKFSPDSNHLYWATIDSPLATTVYVDGQPAVTANGHIFRTARGQLAVTRDGTGWFFAADGDVVKRYKITPDATVTLATLMEKGSAIAAAAPAKAPATAATPAVPAAAPAPAPRPAPVAAPSSATPSAAPSAAVAALTWSDIVRRIETRPPVCTVLREFKFQGGLTIRAGTPVMVLEVQPNELVVSTVDGATNFGVKPQETDIVDIANKLWAQLTPVQRELSYASLLKRPELWPYNLKLVLPFTLDGRKTKVGDPVTFLGVENGQLLVRLDGTDITFNVAPHETNLLSLARTLVANGSEAPGRLLQEFSGKTVSPLNGAPSAINPSSTTAKYIVLYMGAGWCGPCQAFSPALVKALKDKGAKGSDFLPIYVSGDRSPAEAKTYATKIGIDWPTIYFKNRGQLPAFGSLFGDVIPQLVVTDRHGKVLIDSAKSGHARALQQLQQL